MKEATSMMTTTRCSWSLAVLLATLVNPSFAEEPLSRVQIAKIGKAGTALVEARVRQGRRTMLGHGSAFCIHPSGLFITNEHVAQGDLTLILKPGTKAEKAYKAKIVRSDKKLDLALLRIDGVKDLPTLSLGSDDKLAEQMDMVAVGFPLGKALDLEKGYPSASINAGSITALRRRKRDDALLAIQLDVVLNPGNSGGPVLDKNGKVVGVVAAGIPGRGVNLAIPVSVLARFVARPDIHFDPPQLDPANIHKPVLFEAVVLPVLQPTTPIKVELVLKAGKGKERTIPLKAAADGKYRARVVPLPPPPGGATVRLLAEFENSLLNATTADRTFKVGVREVKLSEVARIQFRPAVRVVLHDGKALKGVVSGLEAVPVRLGEQSVPVNLVKAAAVQLGPAAETDQVWCMLVVRQGEKEILRQTERLAVESFLPSPAAMLEKTEAKVGEIRSFGADGHRIIHLALSPNGKRLLTAGADGSARYWDIATGKEIHRLMSGRGQVYGAAFSPDGRKLLTSGEDGLIHVWDAGTGKELKQLRGHTANVVGVAVSPDGRLVVSAGWDRTLRLWNFDTGEMMGTLKGHTDSLMGVAFSPNGKLIASWGSDRTVRLWDVKEQKEVRRLEGHSEMVRAAAFSADGSRLLSGSIGGNGSLRLWEVTTGKALLTISNIRGGVHGLAISADVRQALSGGGAGLVQLWNLESGKEINALKGHGSAVTDAAFLARGRTALSVSGNGKIRLWGLPALSPWKDRP
jgi:WD40 repeat protein